jgi:ADP-ribosylglycohydrolase
MDTTKNREDSMGEQEEIDRLNVWRKMISHKEQEESIKLDILNKHKIDIIHDLLGYQGNKSDRKDMMEIIRHVSELGYNYLDDPEYIEYLRDITDEYERERIRNSLWGFIYGDCIGVPYEFKAKGTFKFKLGEGGGFHDQPPWTWSDDTSLLLSTIDGYNPDSRNPVEVIKNNLQKVMDGYYSVNGLLFDIGTGTANAIRSQFTASTEKSLGNGGLSRIAPLLLTDADYGPVYELTHNYSESKDYIERYRQLFLLESQDFPEYIPPAERVSEGSIWDAVETCEWALFNHKSLSDVIELGGDTDSNAALYGAILGYRGMEDFYKKRRKIRNWEFAEGIIEGFIGGRK